MKYIYLEELWHGADYNPDQWLDHPEILEEDIELMVDTKTNALSIGMFSWTSLEPEEGQYNFEWLDEVLDNLHSIGVKVALATPSGARPAWMAQKYPEVLRYTARREKNLYGERHNHCFTSPVYREKVQAMNTQLAKRYKDHPAVALWHVSNEYGGECHCDLCQEAFREWLKEKYGSLDKLNASWWNRFWSHTITDWSQIESPSPLGDTTLHGKNLDWRRFVSDQTIDFYEDEIKPLKEITPDIPLTTNFMADTYEMIPFQGLDYAKFASKLDVISWDAYPAWHNDWENTEKLASRVAFMNDLYRSLKDQPFLLLESTPSGVNWHDFNKTKRPGMHYLSSLQMLAHGSNSIMYFQWRKSRGASEKFHGAVVDHDRSRKNRVYQDVKQVGESLVELKEIAKTHRKSKVGILYDWENSWAIDDVQGYGLSTKRYSQTVQDHHRAFWRMDIPTDVITKYHDFKDYDLIIFPMLYMLDEKTYEKIQEFVYQGGHAVSTYMSGVVDDRDLVYMNDWKLQDIFGVNVLETDTLYEKQSNAIVYQGKKYQVKDYCSILESKSAETVSVYQDDFYSGTPAITQNKYGKGTATYIGARLDDEFHFDFYKNITEAMNIQSNFPIRAAYDVSIQSRYNKTWEYIFVMNFSEEVSYIHLDEEMEEFFSEEMMHGTVALNVNEGLVLKRKRQ